MALKNRANKLLLFSKQSNLQIFHNLKLSKYLVENKIKKILVNIDSAHMLLHSLGEIKQILSA